MSLSALRALLEPGRRLVVQAHDYPDFDAVAAAFGLGKLLDALGHPPAALIYGGEIQGFSLLETLKQLKIPLTPLKDWIGRPDDLLIAVDGHWRPGHMSQPPGRLLAVLDHHEGQAPPVPYADIRPELGSTSTMVWQYWREAGLKPDTETATALLMGLMMDTASLTRGVTPDDLEALSALYFLANWRQGSYLLKNSLSVTEAPLFRQGLEHLRVEEGFAFTWLDDPAGAEAIALMADDFLRFHEVQVSVVVGPSHGEMKVSVRSEDPLVPAHALVSQALEGWGRGGGHVYMGGGVIALCDWPGPERLFERFRQVLRRLVLIPHPPKEVSS